MKNDIYQVALIGYGGIGCGHHAPKISSTERIDIAGVYDIDPKKNRQASEDGYKVYESFEAALEDKDVDIILIATPNHHHKNLAIRAMEAGKNVICEKPVMLNSEELQQVLDVAEKTGKLFVVHQNRRWDPDFLIIKNIYETHEIGKVFNIETRAQGSRGIPGDWRKYAEFGGGMMLDWGVHLIDRLLWMIPEKVKKVFCELSYILEEDCDDGLKMKLFFESGLTATVEVCTTNFDTLPQWYVNGTTGACIINDWNLNGRITKLLTYEGNESKPIVAGVGLTKTMAPRDESTVSFNKLPNVQSDVRDFYRNVINHLDGKEDIIVKNSEVMRVMRLFDCAKKSHELCQVLDFE